MASMAGEVIVWVSGSADWWRAGLMLLTAAVLLMAELATLGGAGQSVTGLLWLGCAAVGLWRWPALGEWTGAHRAPVTFAAAAATFALARRAAHRLPASPPGTQRR